MLSMTLNLWHFLLSWPIWHFKISNTIGYLKNSQEISELSSILFIKPRISTDWLNWLKDKNCKNLQYLRSFHPQPKRFLWWNSFMDIMSMKFKKWKRKELIWKKLESYSQIWLSKWFIVRDLFMLILMQEILK